MSPEHQANLDYLAMMCRELEDSIERARISGRVPQTEISFREMRYQRLMDIGQAYRALAQQASKTPGEEQAAVCSSQTT